MRDERWIRAGEEEVRRPCTLDMHFRHVLADSPVLAAVVGIRSSALHAQPRHGGQPKEGAAREHLSGREPNV